MTPGTLITPAGFEPGRLANGVNDLREHSVFCPPTWSRHNYPPNAARGTTPKRSFNHNGILARPPWAHGCSVVKEMLVDEV